MNPLKQTFRIFLIQLEDNGNMIAMNKLLEILVLLD